MKTVPVGVLVVPGSIGGVTSLGAVGKQSHLGPRTTPEETSKAECDPACVFGSCVEVSDLRDMPSRRAGKRPLREIPFSEFLPGAGGPETVFETVDQRHPSTGASPPSWCRCVRGHRKLKPEPPLSHSTSLCQLQPHSPRRLRARRICPITAEVARNPCKGRETSSDRNRDQTGKNAAQGGPAPRSFAPSGPIGIRKGGGERRNGDQNDQPNAERTS